MKDRMQDGFGDAGTILSINPNAVAQLIRCPSRTFKPIGPPCPAALLCPSALLGKIWLAIIEPGEPKVLSGFSPSPLSPKMRLCSLGQDENMQEGRRCCRLAGVGLKALTLQEQQCLTVLVQFSIMSPQNLSFAMVPLLLRSAINPCTEGCEGGWAQVRHTHN